MSCDFLWPSVNKPPFKNWRKPLVTRGVFEKIYFRKKLNCTSNGVYRFLKILTEKLEPCFSNSRISPQVRVHTYMCVYSWVCNKLESCFSNSRFYPQFIVEHSYMHEYLQVYTCKHMYMCYTHILNSGKVLFPKDRFYLEISKAFWANWVGDCESGNINLK